MCGCLIKCVVHIHHIIVQWYSCNLSTPHYFRIIFSVLPCPREIRQCEEVFNTMPHFSRDDKYFVLFEPDPHNQELNNTIIEARGFHISTDFFLSGKEFKCCLNLLFIIKDLPFRLPCIICRTTFEECSYKFHSCQEWFILAWTSHNQRGMQYRNDCDLFTHPWYGSHSAHYRADFDACIPIHSLDGCLS
ncbi:hypothetical protein D3C80_806290 [compost metagenome]